MEQPLALYSTKALDLTSVNNALIIPLNGSRRIMLSVSGLTGSGAELRVYSSNDNGVSFNTNGWVGVISVDYPREILPMVINGDYLMTTGMYTHLKVYPFQPGRGVASMQPVPLTFSDLAALGGRL